MCVEVDHKVDQLRRMLKERKQDSVADDAEDVLPQQIAQRMQPEQVRARALHAMEAVLERCLQLGTVAGEQRLQATKTLRQGVPPHDDNRWIPMSSSSEHAAWRAGVCQQLRDAACRGRGPLAPCHLEGQHVPYLETVHSL